jgi:hypothetical protein
MTRRIERAVVIAVALGVAVIAARALEVWEPVPVILGLVLLMVSVGLIAYGVGCDGETPAGKAW